MGAKVVGEQRALPGVGQMPAVDDFQSAIFGAAWVQAGQDPVGSLGGDERRAGKDIVDALAAGAVGGKRLSPAVEGVPPGIDQPAGEDFQLERFGAELPDAAGREPAHAPGRFEMAVDVDRLVEVEQSVGTPAEGVQQVVGVFGAESPTARRGASRPGRRRRCP